MSDDVEKIIDQLNENDARKLKYELGRWRQHHSDGKFRVNRTENMSGLTDIGLIRLHEDPPRKNSLLLYEINPTLREMGGSLYSALCKRYPEQQAFFDPGSGEIIKASETVHSASVKIDVYDK